MMFKLSMVSMVKGMNNKYRTINMKKLVVAVALLSIMASSQVYAQGRQPRDPKKMTEMVAKKLNFSDDQNKQLVELNNKYTGDDFDREAYRNDFHKIMTEDQKKQLEELRQKRMGKSRRGGVN